MASNIADSQRRRRISVRRDGVSLGGREVFSDGLLGCISWSLQALVGSGNGSCFFSSEEMIPDDELDVMSLLFGVFQL